MLTNWLWAELLFRQLDVLITPQAVAGTPSTPSGPSIAPAPGCNAESETLHVSEKSTELQTSRGLPNHIEMRRPDSAENEDCLAAFDIRTEDNTTDELLFRKKHSHQQYLDLNTE
jgi:hypothetical protein